MSSLLALNTLHSGFPSHGQHQFNYTSTTDSTWPFYSDTLANSTDLYNPTDFFNTPAAAVTKAVFTRRQLASLKYIQVGVGITGALGNLLVVFVIFTYTNLHRQPMTKYVINQSVVDALCSTLLAIGPWLNMRQTPSIPWYWVARVYCSLWGTKMVLWATTVTSAYNLVAISLERFFAIRYPIRYREVARKKWTGFIVILSCWVFGYTYTYAIDNMSTFVDAKGNCKFIWPSRAANRRIAYSTIAFKIALPLAVHGFCYTSIALKLIGRSKSVAPSMDTVDESSMAVSSSEVADHSTVGSEKRRDMKMRAKRSVIKLLAIVTVAYLICWIPHRIMEVMFRLGIDKLKNN